jgi:hypothetical protein
MNEKTRIEQLEDEVRELRAALIWHLLYSSDDSKKPELVKRAIKKKLRNSGVSKTPQEIDICGSKEMVYLYTEPQPTIQVSKDTRKTLIGLDENGGKIFQYETGTKSTTQD